MKQLLILAASDYSFIDKATNKLNEGQSFTYISNTFEYCKQSCSVELYAEIKKHNLPAIFGILDFENKVKKGEKPGTQVNTFSITEVKFVKEQPIFDKKI